MTRRKVGPCSICSGIGEYGSYFRLFSRLISGRIRLIFFSFVLIVIVMYLIKSLQPARDYSNLIHVEETSPVIMNQKDNLKYAVMIDAGSSGSRAHIYVWSTNLIDKHQLIPMKMLEDHNGQGLQKKISPGLSSCSVEPSYASKYIRPLLEFSSRHVPKHLHKETPLFILATAGMRLLEQNIQDNILDHLRRELQENWDFLYSENHVQVISGKEEGIFSWISINYILGKFDHSIQSEKVIAVNFPGHSVKPRPQTVSVLEMGGASVQIAFEITSKYDLEEIKRLKRLTNDRELESVLSKFNLGCSIHDNDHTYLLYVETYLGLGANEARTLYVNALIDADDLIKKKAILNTTENIIFDSCLPQESEEVLHLKGSNKSVKLVGTGNYEDCELKLINLTSSSSYKNDFKSPIDQLKTLRVPFVKSEFFGFSEFWYTMEDVLNMGGKYSYERFKQASSDFCSTKWIDIEEGSVNKLYPNADLQRLLYQCFKSAWTSVILHHGFRMPKTYANFKSVMKVNDFQVEWTLGALLYKMRLIPEKSSPDQLFIDSYQPSNASYLDQTIFILCMIAVLVCIIIYLRHLHNLVESNVFYGNLSNDSSFLEVKIENVPLIDSSS